MSGQSVGPSVAWWAIYRTAKALYLDEGQVDLPELLNAVGDATWKAALDAFEFYRGCK